jgi:hypothetical protein
MSSTGLLKAGCLIGDHVKTAIGTLLPSGSVIGTGSNLFGSAGMAPKWVPSFVWGTGRDSQEYDLGRFLDTAETVCRRRGCVLSKEERAVMDAVFRMTRSERDQYLRARG